MVDMDELRNELERQKNEKGLSYVKAKRLDIDANNQEIGKALSEAEDEGWVEAWGGTLSTSWRILL